MEHSVRLGICRYLIFLSCGMIPTLVKFIWFQFFRMLAAPSMLHMFELEMEVKESIFVYKSKKESSWLLNYFFLGRGDRWFDEHAGSPEDGTGRQQHSSSLLTLWRETRPTAQVNLCTGLFTSTSASPHNILQLSRQGCQHLPQRAGRNQQGTIPHLSRLQDTLGSSKSKLYLNDWLIQIQHFTQSTISSDWPLAM